MACGANQRALRRGSGAGFALDDSVTGSFRRQHPIGRYIVDFYSAELKLAIELDGNHHAAEWMIDHESERTRELRNRGTEVVRIPNELLIRDSESVGECIKAAIERRVACLLGSR